MKNPNDPKVVNIADARARKKPKAPPAAPIDGIAISLPDLTDITVLLDIAFGLMSVGDPGLKQLRKSLRKKIGKKEVAVVHKAVNGLLKHLGPDDAEHVLDKALAILAEARGVLPVKP